MTHSTVVTSLNFQDLQAQVISQLEQDIETLFASVSLPSPLKQACQYAMTGQGKRVRPLLLASSFASISTGWTMPSNVRRAMLAVELVHTYSLIHDDLPCMDDDALRRGRPTTHIEFGEATALLAGDVLQSLAFEVLSTDIEGFESIDPVLSAQLVSCFAPRARRMVSGQMLDLEGENTTLNQEELQAIHADKTGALIEASVLLGAICASASVEQLQILTRFAQNLGLAFQVQDDILDVTADTAQLGKPSGSDEKLDKSTYVKLMGVEQAREYAKQLFIEGKDSLQNIETVAKDNMLIQLADWLWMRKK